MSKKRELLSHVNQLNGIREIMAAMKNLAVLESHKLSGRLDNLRKMVTELRYCAADFIASYTIEGTPVAEQHKVLILFGSERGFCGDFNDKLLRYIQQYEAENSTANFILVGQKLISKLEEDSRVIQTLEGPSVAEDVGPNIDILISYLSELAAKNPAIQIDAIFQDSDSCSVERRQLVPPLLEKQEHQQAVDYSVDINLTIQEVLADLMQHYLFVLLHEITYLSLMAENHDRIQHMNGAINKLDETCENLTRRYHIERQEEITEEIEVILLNAVDLS